MFTTASLNSYTPAIVACAQKVCERLLEQNGQEIELSHYMGRLTMDIVGHAAFGCVFSNL